MGIFHRRSPQVCPPEFITIPFRSGIQDALSDSFPIRLREETQKQYGRYPGYCPATHIPARCVSIGSFQIGTGVETRTSREFGPSASKINPKEDLMKRNIART